MSGVFISYRRSDSSGYAGRIYDYLRGYFGESQVFMDVDNIEAGQDFRSVLHMALHSCNALIVIIGKEWVSNRLYLSDDFVRYEIEFALNRNILVVPILVDNAQVPNLNRLPASLWPLLNRQILEINNTHFDHDIQKLAIALETQAMLIPQPKLFRIERQQLEEIQPQARKILLRTEDLAKEFGFTMFELEINRQKQYCTTQEPLFIDAQRRLNSIYMILQLLELILFCIFFVCGLYMVITSNYSPNFVMLFLSSAALFFIQLYITQKIILFPTVKLTRGHLQISQNKGTIIVGKKHLSIEEKTWENANNLIIPNNLVICAYYFSTTNHLLSMEKISGDE